MARSELMSLHRGTEVAIVASYVLGGHALVAVPLALLSVFVIPGHVPGWRITTMLIGFATVVAGMVALARSLAARRRWARPVGIFVLAA